MMKYRVSFSIKVLSIILCVLTVMFVFNCCGSNTTTNSDSGSGSGSDKVSKQCVVTYELNGGKFNGGDNSVTVKKGSSLDKPDDPIKADCWFAGWTYDEAHTNKVEWPITVDNDTILYATFNQKIDTVSVLHSMIDSLSVSPYSYIPSTMLAGYEPNLVLPSALQYDFSTDTNTSSIIYGGFGEQWQMILNAASTSQLFFDVLTATESIMTVSVSVYNNYLDDNPDSKGNATLDETDFTAEIRYENNVLFYDLQIHKDFTIAGFEFSIKPSIRMTYEVSSGKKEVKIGLTDNNVIYYTIENSNNTIGLKFGTENSGIRALIDFEKDTSGTVKGSIYEFLTLEGVDFSNHADFYINDSYVTAVGSKANGMMLANSVIVELYKTSTGKLLAYEVYEDATLLKYDTLWFNLSDVTGITSVRAPEHSQGDNKNPNDIYLNGSLSIFEPSTTFSIKQGISRKYDIELRKQYFYSYNAEKEQIVEHCAEIPMMFIQESNLDEYSSEIKSKNNITSSVTLSSVYINQLMSEYDAFVPVYLENDEVVTVETVLDFIG